LLLGGALAGLPLLGADEAVPALIVFASLSLAAVVVSLLWRPLLGFVLVGFALVFLARELHGHVGAGATVAFAAGLLALSELIAWAHALRSRALVEPSYAVRRAASLAVATAVGGAAAGLTVAAASISSPNTLVAGVAGAAAVVALAALVLRLGRGAV
jgi:hypothetical protein